MITFNTSNSVILKLKNSILETLQLVSLRDHLDSNTFEEWLQDLTTECEKLETILKEEFKDDDDIEHIILELNKALDALRGDNLESIVER